MQQEPEKGGGNLIDIDELRKINKPENIVLTEHARLRLFERNIFLRDVMRCIDCGEIIKQYEDDKPFPSCLVLGMSVNNKYLHVVVSMNNNYIYLITAYYPNLEQWEADFKTRRERKE